MSIKYKIIKNKIPKHVAIIMDGNGRWAAAQGKERVFGHIHGVESVRSVVEGAAEIGIKYLTLYTFSKENWSRPKDEIKALMDLLIQAIDNEVSSLKKNGIRLEMIGDFGHLPENVKNKLFEAIECLKECSRMTLILALNYSSRWEITQGVIKIANDVKSGKIKLSDINENVISNCLITRKIPDPDLLIRTSGECRLSNFLLWQLAYSELYFTSVLWPDYRKEDFFDAICNYQKRERRFGKTSEQIDR